MSISTADEVDRTLVPTAVLTGLTLVTAIGMGRLFAGTRFLLPCMVMAVVVHGFSFAARKRAVPTALATSATFGVILLVLAWVALPHTTAFGIPWRGSISALTTGLSEASRDFSTAVAPTPVTTGFLLAAMIGVGLVAWLSDWAAFRIGSTFEGAVPAFGLFALTSVLGDARHRWPAVAAEVAALTAYMVVHAAHVRSSSTPWFASRNKEGRRALLQGGALLVVAAVISAVIIGPRLPGAEARPIVAVRNQGGDGPSKRTTISPLVDIRGRLVDRSNVEAFTVQASGRAYWRLTALDTFDGTIWSSNDSYRRADGNLSGDPAGQAPGATSIIQNFTITDLASIWLPAAFRPARIGGVDGVSFNRDSGSLISREASSDGMRYQVASNLPTLNASQLAGATALPTKDKDRYLTLTTISPRVAAKAAEVAGGGEPFERARKLQDFFRSGEFTYDLGVNQGHDERALENFVFNTKAGYCEQFAGAYAVMARSIGLPSRVAVGFTPGELGPDGVYHVLGLHAHAWPEVHFDGFGWVAFEPTPGRGMPNAEAYTGVPDQQASITDNQTPTTLGTTTTTELTGSGGGATTTSTTAPAPASNQPIPRRAPLPIWLMTVVGLIVTVLAAWAIGVPTARRVRRSRRRAAALTTADRVLVAWQEADETLALARARRRGSETLAEHAARATKVVPGIAHPLARLARDASVASYAEEVPAELAADAIAAAAEVEATVTEGATRGQRLKRELSLRG